MDIDHRITEGVSFKWNIISNLSLAVKFEAGFYLGDLYILPYHATFQPLYRCNNWLHYLITLQPLPPLDDDVIAGVLGLTIFINSNLIYDEYEFAYTFDTSNEYKFSYYDKMEMNSELKEQYVIIMFDLIIAPTKLSGMTSKYTTCLKHLSRDMKNLLKKPIGAEMRLKAKDSDKRFLVHSYILDVRFKKFFEYYQIDEENEYKLDISSDVLWDILEYVYTGRIREGWKAWSNENMSTEMCYAIDKFQLYEILKYVMKSDKGQQRVTKNYSFVQPYVFLLNIIDGRPANKFSFSRYLNIQALKLDFNLRVETNEANWLSFSLHSDTDFSIFAEVNLQLVKKEGGRLVEVIPFHTASFTLSPKATEDSGPVLFLGCPETFGDPDGRNYDFSIRCDLTVSSTQMAQQLLCWESPRNDTKEEAMLLILSDHMDLVRKRRIGTTFEICSRRHSEDEIRLSDFIHEGILSDHMDLVRKRRIGTTSEICSRRHSEDAIRLSDLIHEGIFKARLPRWWEAINLNEDDLIPNRAHSILEKDSFKDIIGYIYTGRIKLSIFDSIITLMNIKSFASQTNFRCLEEEIDRWKLKGSGESV